MKRINTIATVFLAIGLVFGATACDEEKAGENNSTCGADLHLQLGPSTCDFAANEVECFYWTEVDDGFELEVVGCMGESSSCELEFMVALYEGEPVDGELGLYDASEDFEAEGDLVPDVWELELTDSQLRLSFAGTLEGEGSPAVEGCIGDLPWTDDNPEEDDDDDDDE